MSEPDTHQPDPSKEAKDAAKAEKKAAKAQVKLEKERAKAQQRPHSVPGEPPGARKDFSDLTPAERSAAAAERQVKLQRWRVIIALLTFAIAAATLLITTKPWRAPPDNEQESTPATNSDMSQ